VVDRRPAPWPADSARGYARVDDEHACCVESGIDGREFLTRPNHQAGADEQHNRHGHFRDDEHGAQTLQTDAAGSPAGRFLERIRESRQARVQGGRETEEDATQDRDACREGQHRPIQARLHERGEPNRTQCGDGLHGQRRKPETCGGTGQRQHATLRDELPEQPCRSGAERGAHRDLLLPHLRPSDQEVRDIRAGDEEYETDRGHQRPDHRLQRPVDLCLERINRDGALVVCGWIRLGQLRGNAVEFRLCLLDGRARLQARKRREAAVEPILELPGAQHERHPEPRVVRHAGESRCHHANHRVRLAAEPNRAIHNVRISAETPPPESIAQHGDVVAIWHAIFVLTNVRPYTGATLRSEKYGADTNSTGTRSGSSGPSSVMVEFQ
jgi:hypothetical protein